VSSVTVSIAADADVMCIPCVGIFYTTAIIGPAIGYIVGGKLLEVYCDVGSVDLGK